MTKKIVPTLLPLLAAFMLQSCSVSNFYDPGDSAPDRHVNVNNIPDATPRVEPRSKRGNPSSYTVFGKRYHVKGSSKGHVERGIASWYGTKFHGRLTSSGEPYDMLAMTAAHKSLPLPTYARVTNLDNGRSVVVKINDRGPFAKNRIIDLSYVAAKKLGITARGTGLVEVRAIDPKQPQATIRTASETPAPKAVAADEKLASATDTPRVYLQLGAFQSRENAVRLRDKVAEIPMANVQVQQAGARTPIFRVRIGPLASVDEVDELSNLLERHGLNSSRVVID